MKRTSMVLICIFVLACAACSSGASSSSGTDTGPAPADSIQTHDSLDGGDLAGDTKNKDSSDTLLPDIPFDAPDGTVPDTTGLPDSAAVDGTDTGAPDSVDSGSAELRDGGSAELRDGGTAELPDGAASGDAGVATDTAADSQDLEDNQDVVIPCVAGEGCFLEKCEAHEACFSGLCLEHLGEGVCTALCTKGCDAGWTCTEVAPPSGAPLSVCLSDYPSLCRPCVTSEDCAAMTGQDFLCLDAFGIQGYFCGAPCGPQDWCPKDYECADVMSVEGDSVRQCVPVSGDCPCTEKSIAEGRSTVCLSEANEWGACSGTRTCGEAGLSDCDAPVAAAETCNGKDDDCDGRVDNNRIVGQAEIPLCQDDCGCTEDLCLGEDGCRFLPLTGGACDDENECTKNDTCEAGACVGTPIVCDDGNPCRKDSCDPLLGCQSANEDGIPCDDKSKCTVTDTCSAGVCVGTGAPNCDDGLECTKDSCDPATGCVNEKLTGTACDDKSKCTVTDACSAGVCVGTGAPNCDDGLECTKDSCDPATGCVNEKLTGTACDDKSKCTVTDACSAGICVGTGAPNCDDGLECTKDSCDPATGCVNEKLTGTACDDKSKCTVTDTCSAGICVGTGAPNCDDGLECTKDTCDPATGCVNEKLTGTACDDKSKCTVTDTCSAGICVGTGAPNCDDGLECTKDSCDPATGCVNEKLTGTACDDKSKCTVTDTCSAGICVGTGAPNCDDGLECTKDSCDPATGCVNEKLTGTACDDKSKCTVTDTCSAGICVGTGAPNCDDGLACTKDSCDPATGCVNEKLTGTGCNDNDKCTVTDTCSAGICVGTGAPNCDDSKDCTKDTCDPAMGCVNDKLTGTACNDNDKCTVTDTCSAGICVGSGALSCPDDTNPCTDKGCVPATGCVQVANTASCEDGDLCTSSDKCENTICKPGATVVCPDDKNVCTSESCVPALGCVITNLDGPKCGTLPNETCKSGVCVCTPNCTGRVCGDNGCAGSCGTCADPQHVCLEGLCGHTYATIPYSTGFEVTALDSSWRLETSDSAQIALDATIIPKTGSKLLASWKTVATAATAGSTRALLHLNAEGRDNVVLSYWWKQIGAEVMTSEDGLSLSVDGGLNWTSVDYHKKDFGTGNPVADTWYFRKFNLSAAAHLAGLTLSAKTIVRFGHQALNTAAANAGVGIDDVSVSLAACPTLPLTGGFEETADLVPSWVSWGTTLQGRVRVTGPVGNARTGVQAIQLDSLDSVNGAETETRICANLAGETSVVLTFWWTDYKETEDDTDAVYISADGGKNFTKVFSYYAVTHQDSNWRVVMMDLGAVAKSNGLTLTSNFVVLFRAKSKLTIGSGGFSLDDIKLHRAPVYATVPYSTGFEPGEFDDSWFVTYPEGGRIRTVDKTDKENVAKEGSWSMQMDQDSSALAGTFINQADLYVNLLGETNLFMEFWWKEYDEETDPEDGLFLSVDAGKTFTQLIPLKDGAKAVWDRSLVNISGLAATAGLPLSATSILRFQAKSNDAINKDGMAFDAVSLKRGDSTTYVSIPLFEAFALPVLPTGFSTYSARTGRVTITDLPGTAGDNYALMDSSTATIDGNNALNINLNLAGKTGVLMRMKLKDFAEDNDAWDGLWFSNNGGATFVKAFYWDNKNTADATWTNQQFDIDYLAALAGVTYSDQFVVSIRQTDNNIAPARGVGVDNIRFTFKTRVSTFPYYTGFETDNGELDTNWSCQSTGKGHCFVGSANTPFVGSWHLYMDTEAAPISNNAALLRLDLSGTTTSMAFQMQLKGFVEEVSAAEGVFISDDDGVTFSRVRSYYSTGTLPAAWTLFSFNLTDEATFYGLNPKSSKFVVMILQTGDKRIPNDGLAIDEVRVQ